jgi:hypothetical protein
LAKRYVLGLILSLLLVLPLGKARASSNAAVTLTVKVIPFHGIVVELYDENGRLIERTDPAMPPLDVVMTTPEDLEVGLYIPETTLMGPTTIGIHLGGTTLERADIDRADEEGTERGMKLIPGLGPIEFTADRHIGTNVTISMPYLESIEGALVHNLAIFGLDEEDPKWTRVPGSRVVPSTHSVRAVVDRFGIYRVMAMAASDLANVVVYPNPFIPSGAHQGCLKFINLTPQAKIRVYSLVGDLVWSKEVLNSGGAAQWYGKNNNDEPVASGIYLYIVTDPNGEEATGKISVIR